MRGLGVRFAMVVAAVVGVAFVAPPPSGASAATGAGVAWLAAHQESDGGFELADFPGFETPDAVLAIAGAAQTGSWDVCTARSAVLAVANGGRTGLDALDDLAEQQGDDVGIAAKLVVLTALPLGLDARDVDPSGDSATPVDLVATILAAQQPDGQFKAGALNATALSVIALQEAQGVVTAASVAYLESTQTADGSWQYAGANEPGDVDTTALVLQALFAIGRTPSDGVVAAGLGYLARNQNADGSWSAFGSPDPNSTATATMALWAAGFDPTTSAWRDGAAPELVGTSYGSPLAFLAAQQQGDGRFASPNDGWGVNTFATAQSIEALAGVRLPVDAPLGPVTCSSTPTPSTPAPSAPAPGASGDSASANAPVEVSAAQPGDGESSDALGGSAFDDAGSIGAVGQAAGADAANGEPTVAGTSVTRGRGNALTELSRAQSASATGSGVQWGVTIGVGVLLGVIGGGCALIARRRRVAGP